MAELVLAEVSKVYRGGVEAVCGLDLHVADGELMVLLGPSGCGKTTTLRLIAGLETPTGGTIRIGSRDVAGLPPGDRGVAMVFQEHGLYPHLSVRANLVFNPRQRGVPVLQRERLARRAAELAGIRDLMQRMPSSLSGGERQRVAVARAIAADPGCLLLDEPLGSLDAPLRHQLRGTLRALHRSWRRTTLYVTHDQQEAMTLGERLAVMRDGRLQQVGTPAELFARPVNRFVAGFLGSPPMSFIEGTIEPADGEAWFTDGHTVRLRVPGAPAGAAVLGIRPAALVPSGPDAPGIRVRVETVEPLGDHADVQGTTAGGSRVTARVPAGAVPREGDTVAVGVGADGLHWFEPGVLGRRLGP